MNLTRCYLIIGLFFSITAVTHAQQYDRAVGLRFGYPLSVSYKKFINYTDAVELYAGWRGWRRYRAFSLNGAYQIHRDFPDVRGLQWYYGGGAGVQLWSYDNYERGSATVSLSGYLGLEYLIPDVPLTISVDWRPTIYLGTQRDDGFHNLSVSSGAVAVRYLF
ncbi:hypothetical protein CLV84_2042 [Neolewinella xylanilytica]|uniref:Outer membrane protein beta-barrel domain-containing protein n=1 Tax=Neolewinella xylanilytica TaxID=1514080 RepID=A0A2S6I1X2_9BACT|nr:hypothetical protein [Neolewinella xylanilytica]PPK85150.1 hypothetical protein CLV84_2042 [Neolewinella xylanilytica]